MAVGWHSNVVGAYAAATSGTRVIEVGTADRRLWMVVPADSVCRGRVCELMAAPRLRRA